MAKSPKGGRVIFPVGVKETDASPTTVKDRVLKPVDLPPPMRISDHSAKNHEAPGDGAAGYEAEIEMVLIHSGEFLMGDNEGARDQQPHRPVLLNSYWIDIYPVTNADYKGFIEATGHRKPPNWVRNTFPEEKGNHPVSNVSFEDANAYAQWAGKRLPTEAEWEKAARGTIGQTFPWGDAFRKDNVNSHNDHGGTTPVDHAPGGASPYGVQDMCGNVMEWCQDWYYDEYYKKAPRDNPEGPPGGKYHSMRGGFYAGNKSDVKCAARHWAPAANMQDHIGFRCTKTPARPGEVVQPPGTSQVVQPKTQEEPKMDPISEDQSLVEIARHHPESVAKVIRAGLHEDQSRAANQASILMITLGRDTAAGIMKYMMDSEIEIVASAMAGREVVTAEERDAVQNDVKSRILSGTHLDYGGADYTSEVLELAMGPRKARAFMDRAIPNSPSARPLMNMDPNVIVPFMAKEHPQTIALILSQLDPKKMMAILDGLGEALRNDVLYRIGSLESVRVTTLRSLEEALSNELWSVATGQVEVGGAKAVAEALKHSEDPEELVGKLKERDAELAGEVSEEMGGGPSIRGQSAATRDDGE